MGIDVHDLGMFFCFIGIVRWAMSKPFNWIDITALSMGVVMFFV